MAINRSKVTVTEMLRHWGQSADSRVGTVYSRMEVKNDTLYCNAEKPIKAIWSESTHEEENEVESFGKIEKRKGLGHREETNGEKMERIE